MVSTMPRNTLISLHSLASGHSLQCVPGWCMRWRPTSLVFVPGKGVSLSDSQCVWCSRELFIALAYHHVPLLCWLPAQALAWGQQATHAGHRNQSRVVNSPQTKLSRLLECLCNLYTSNHLYFKWDLSLWWVCVCIFEACRLSPPRCLRFESKKNNTSGSDSLDVALCGQEDYLRICQAGLANIDRGSEASRPVWAETWFDRNLLFHNHTSFGQLTILYMMISFEQYNIHTIFFWLQKSALKIETVCIVQ